MYEVYFEKLKKECQIRNRTEGTLKTYIHSITFFLNWVKKSPEDVTLEDAKAFIYELRVNQKKSTQYCNGIHSALKFFYRFVLKKVWNDDVVPRMMNDLKLPKVITLEEVERLIDTATEVRNKAIIALLYSSGLRVSELCNLAPGDIYMSTMQVHIRGSKNHCDHWTILSQRTLDLLIEYWKTNPVKREYFFIGSKQQEVPLRSSGVEIMLRKLNKETGLEHVTPHTLRHSFASHMVEQGVSLENIQAMMGHRDPASTHKYIHVSNKSLMGIKSPLDHPEVKKKTTKKKNNRKKKDE